MGHRRSVEGMGLGLWWKLLSGLRLETAGMGCFGLAQHDRVVAWRQNA